MNVELYAPRSYWRQIERGIQPGNGCGTSGVAGKLVPDTLYGLSITAACNIHDHMYEIGLFIKDKEEADRIFLNNMLRIIKAHNRFRWLTKLRAARAHTYYLAVKTFGGPAFWNGKNGDTVLGTMEIS